MFDTEENRNDRPSTAAQPRFQVSLALDGLCRSPGPTGESLEGAIDQANQSIMRAAILRT